MGNAGKRDKKLRAAPFPRFLLLLFYVVFCFVFVGVVVVVVSCQDNTTALAERDNAE